MSGLKKFPPGQLCMCPFVQTVWGSLETCTRVTRALTLETRHSSSPCLVALLVRLWQSLRRGLGVRGDGKPHVRVCASGGATMPAGATLGAKTEQLPRMPFCERACELLLPTKWFCGDGRHACNRGAALCSPQWGKGHRFVCLCCCLTASQ